MTQSKMTQTWSCLEDGTHNIVMSIMLILREKHRGVLLPNLGCQGTLPR